MKAAHTTIPTAMEVHFREIDPFNCWIWFRFPLALGQGERGYLETALDSWFFLGKLGGFNAENLQAHEAGADLSWMAWDDSGAVQALPALMHNMSPLEVRGEWARFWVDLGTSDALALDVLINTLQCLDRDVVEIEEVLIGGLQEDWPIDEEPDSPFLRKDD